jgi:hypothetical protein
MFPFLPSGSSLPVLRIASHPVLDVVVASPEPSRRDAYPERSRRDAYPERSRRDEVQLLFRESVMGRQDPVNFVDDGRAGSRMDRGEDP